MNHEDFIEHKLTGLSLRRWAFNHPSYKLRIINNVVFVKRGRGRSIKFRKGKGCV